MIRYGFIALFAVLALSGPAASAPQGQGGLRVADNPHWLEFGGRPILPVGDSVTQGWIEGGTHFDQRAYLDALAARGINTVLLWSYFATGAQAQRADVRVAYDAPELWPWPGSPDRQNFDLTRFNPAYFSRLREFVNYAAGKGILVVLTVQDGWPKTRFANHPFNAALGNGPLTDRAQLVELADYESEMPEEFRADWTRRQQNQYFQERFADKLCAELQGCSNLIFEMFNEGEWYAREPRRRHEEHFLRFFRKRTAALLMTNLDHIQDREFLPRENPAVDILSFHKTPWTGHFTIFEKEFHATPARPIIESEPVPGFGYFQPEFGQEAVTLETLRAAVWERTLSGAGWVAQNDLSFGWDPRSALAKQSSLRDRAYDQIGHAARFFNQSGVAFWEMAPHGELAGTGLCLARPGFEYVVCAPKGEAFTVNLAAAAGGTFAARWYDPRTGLFQPAGVVAGGDAAHQFAPPFAGDAVLHLRKPSATDASPSADGRRKGRRPG